jgi:hypothetical protein
MDQFKVVYERASGERLGERESLQANRELPPIGWRVHKGADNYRVASCGTERSVFLGRRWIIEVPFICTPC